MDNFFLEDLVSFVLRYPEHRHYVGVGSIALRQDIAARLTAAGLKTRSCAGAAFNGSALAQLDTGEVNVLLSNPDQLSYGWYTSADKRTISYLHPIDYSHYIQGMARLRGTDCRIGFATKNLIFQDQPIKNIYDNLSRSSSKPGEKTIGRPPGETPGWKA